jgi:hypothetical protein
LALAAQDYWSGSGLTGTASLGSLFTKRASRVALVPSSKLKMMKVMEQQMLRDVPEETICGMIFLLPCM